MLDKLNSASTKRAVRTGFDVALGVLAVVAVIVPSLHQFGFSVDNEAAVAGLVVAATALISKVKNKLEELGYLPAFLKDTEVH
ncbi:hypothetical protein [Kribbella sindirgiensis]|uniref:Holin n=1 Tax=Kribbella sindirgiensis TaxID=1124744 RepID=A0A4R0I092_9ACTN|nr:hypothetical protein [Kribbella sindirgiensis]TCC19970.1 hypothetical protein E0H50_37735 [Kribbella sindirgiensis]